MKGIGTILNSGLLQRGTEAWDLRELARQSVGCRCLSFGALRFDDITRRATLKAPRQYPSPERMAHLQRNRDAGTYGD